MGGLGPNYQNLINQCWPTGVEYSGWFNGGGSNIVTGTNPPYTITDFLAIYPKFGGMPTRISGCSTTQGSTSVTGLPMATGPLQVGQLVIGPGILGGTIILAVESGTITISLPATAAGTNVSLNFITNPLAPLVVIQLFLNLANASLIQNRWDEAWGIAMAWFIAHFLTLFLRSDGNTYCDAGQAATAGLQVGITVSKSAGPVSQGLQLPGGLDDWAAWTTTTYGQQLATMARVIGAGPMLIP